MQHRVNHASLPQHGNFVWCKLLLLSLLDLTSEQDDGVEDARARVTIRFIDTRHVSQRELPAPFMVTPTRQVLYVTYLYACQLKDARFLLVRRVRAAHGEKTRTQAANVF